jgi:hypothetical protein
MQTAYINLIKHALSEGHTVSVWDGEEWQVKRSTSLRAITEAVKSVEEATLRIRNQDGDVVAWALVSAYGLAPDETVIDYGDNDWTNAWFVNYSKTQEA